MTICPHSDFPQLPTGHSLRLSLLLLWTHTYHYLTAGCLLRTINSCLLREGTISALGTTLEKRMWAPDTAEVTGRAAGHVTQTKEYTSHGVKPRASSLGVGRSMVCHPPLPTLHWIFALPCPPSSVMLITQQPTPWPERS